MEKKDLFRMVKKAYPYRHLSSTLFNKVIRILADGIAGSRGRYGAYLYHRKPAFSKNFVHFDPEFWQTSA